MGPGASSGETVRFVIDGEVVELRDVDPTRTVLQLLREDLGRTGTKEGCAEGDCGACTVVLAEPDEAGERLRVRAVNACIQFVPTLDGKQLLTAESLSPPGGPLHPVQQAMVECHGSQCGFCTPGFVMSLFALYKGAARPDRRAVDDALAGNLCRCTGYRPIVAAAGRMYELARELAPDERDWLRRPFPAAGIESGESEALARLGSLRRDGPLALRRGERRYFAPMSLGELVGLAAEWPEAQLLAGGTDVGLWVTKQHRQLDTVIYIGNVPELRRIQVSATHVEIGAAVTFSEAAPVLTAHYPDLDELLRRFASPPIRNVATVGGNVANGSPIGDSMPALIALGATVLLRGRDGARELDLEDYYLDYQQTARAPGEVLERVRVPLPAPAAQLRAYKVSKRLDQDISAVCGAFRLVREGGRVREIRIAYGGLAAIPKRAVACERSLAGAAWSERAVREAMDALDEDFTPISDMRASARYRRAVARNLLMRLYLETDGDPGWVRVYDHGRHGRSVA